MDNMNEILAKIEKIRTLAERGGTLAEAEAAASKMQELLFKHNLTLTDLQTHALRTKRKVERKDYDYKNSANKWKNALLRVLATNNMCESINHPYRSGTTVVGHAHNLIIVEQMYLWLVEEIERLCKVERARLKAEKYEEQPPYPSGPPYDLYRTDHAAYDAAILQQRTDIATYREIQDRNRARYDARNRYSAFRHAFRLGAVAGLGEALRKSRKAIEEQAREEGTWALVPVLEKEVAQAYNEMFPNRTQGRGSRISSSGAYGAGRAAGARINVSRQVGGGGRLALA